MGGMEPEKRPRVREVFEELELDAIVVRNPENVLYFSGYWPITGWSLAIVHDDLDVTLVVPESELPYTEGSFASLVKTLPGETLDDLWRPHELLRGILSEIDLRRGSRIGAELSFETVAANNVAGEANYACMPTFKLIEEVWGATLVDITEKIYELRKIKTRREVGLIELANEIAAIGLKAAREKLSEGAKESEIAAACEASIYSEGVGFRGVSRARGFAFVMSGENTARAWYPYNISTDRRIRRGDLVLIELNVYADGYWADVTRTWCLGSPKGAYQDARDVLEEAQGEFYKNFREGMSAGEADRLVRSFISRTKYGSMFPHRLGHGIGVRLHEPPSLHPKSEEVLVSGTIHTVEPGIYGSDFGIRLEDVVLDRERGATSLTPFDKEL